VNPDLPERTAGGDDLGFFADHRLGARLRLPAPRQPQTPRELDRFHEGAAHNRQ